MVEQEHIAGKISLVVADVDGTLVTEDKVLTSRAQAAAGALASAGIAFAITSGRPPLGMAMLVKPLDLRTPIAAFNGAIFVKPDMTIIQEHRLSPEIAHEAVDLIVRHGLDVWVYSGHDWLIRDPKRPHVAREQWTVKFSPRVVRDFGGALDRAVKIVGVSNDHDAVARCEKDVQSALGERASAARSQPYYLDITHRNANKGMVVATLSRLLSVPPEQIATIGDMPNDLLMFHESGINIAMGNAGPRVKAEAQFITDSYNEDGFAKAIEWFVLGHGRSDGDQAR